MTNLTDAINSMDTQQVSIAAFNNVHVLQDENPATQTSALACLFLLMCEVFNCEARDVLQVADNAMTDRDSGERKEHFVAIRQYMQEELNNV